MREIPSYDTFMNPTLQALRELGGSGGIEEINAKVIEITGLSNEQLEVLHNPEKSSQTEVEYRLAWARTYLKKFGVLENSNRGIWTLTPKARDLEKVDPQLVKKQVREADREDRNKRVSDLVGADETLDEDTWQQEVLNLLLAMHPSAFERLIQRMLRESGFIQVEVTGKSGDGGIDGKGIMRLGGFLSFHVFFQCKRYQGTVSPNHVRDFRGAMAGRADKGLLITTGNFTKDAIREATRDGAQPIDLIDGDLLVKILKDLGLGIKIEQVEQVTVNRDWFQSI